MALAAVRNPPKVKLTLFVDFASQPARAVIAFCRLNQIEHEIKIVELMKGEHLKGESAKKNPAK